MELIRSNIDAQISTVEALLGYSAHLLLHHNRNTQLTWRDNSKTYQIGYIPGFVDVNNKLWTEICIYLPTLPRLNAQNVLTSDHDWRYFGHTETHLNSGTQIHAMPPAYFNANL